jgi:PqqD family protein of HPr-rel-A system
VTTLRDESRITLSAEQVSAQLDGEAVVLDLREGVYFGLNPVATRVWSLLKEAPRSVAELRQAILDEYDVEFEQCNGDLRALLEALKDHGLVDISEQDE